MYVCELYCRDRGRAQPGLCSQAGRHYSVISASLAYLARHTDSSFAPGARPDCFIKLTSAAAPPGGVTRWIERPCSAAVAVWGRSDALRYMDGALIISADISADISANIAPLAESTQQLVHDLTAAAGVRQRSEGLEDARRLRDIAEISPRYRRDIAEVSPR